MAKYSEGKASRGGDAAEMKPRLVPDYELLGRDDSGGPDYDPYTAEFGDGGFVQGEKKHLSVSGGSDDEEEGDEISDKGRVAGYDRDAGSSRRANSKAPSSSKKQSREEE